MLTKDIYGKTLSDSFLAKTESVAQFVKPKTIVCFLESRHNNNPNITIDAANIHSDTSEGSLGFFCNLQQAANGIERQSFLFGVTDTKDNFGNVIRANGSHVAMPPLYDDDLNFGWWSGTQSTNIYNITYDGYNFANNPKVTVTMDPRPCNRIRVSTPEFHGQIRRYSINIFDTASSGAPILQEFINLGDDEYYYDHFLPPSLGHINVDKVEVEVILTKNPQDFARIHEVNLIYEVDVSDLVVDANQSDVRDIHASSLPIAGSSSSSLDLVLDNTGQKFNPFSVSNLYGKFLRKNVKILHSLGWQTVRSKDDIVQTTLASQLLDVDTTVVLGSTEGLPEGGAGDQFVITVSPDKWYREHILISAKAGTYDLTVAQRGYGGTVARTHAVGELVSFDTFEYHSYREFFVNEWGGKYSDMTVTASCSDWSKFAAEKLLTMGFLLEGVTVGEAIENLLMRCNFPRSRYKRLRKNKEGAIQRGAVAYYDFSETGYEKNSNKNTVSLHGLRARFFSTNSVPRDIVADALDRPLTTLEKALGYQSNVYPDFSDNTYNLNEVGVINDLSKALSFRDLSFENKAGDIVRDDYNCVFDGFFVPLDSGVQQLGVDIAHGGARIYLDENLILDSWVIHAVAPGQLTNVDSVNVDLVAGKVYRLRIEAFFEYATNVSESLFNLDFTVDAVAAPRSWCHTNAIIDSSGCADSPYTEGSLDRNKIFNHGVYVVGDEITEGRKEASAILGLPGGMNAEDENYSVEFNGECWGRIPYDISWDLNDSSCVNYTGEWSIELNVMPVAAFSGDGEYVSMFSSGVSPVGGWEFNSTGASHKFRIETSSGIQEIVVAEALSTSEWTHLMVTFDGSVVRYYVDGVEKGSLALDASDILSWANQDITFAGRNARFTGGVGETTPASLRQLKMDQFALYNRCLSAVDVGDRYSEFVIEPLIVYPFIYGNDQTIANVIREITLGDLGRFYIDENNDAVYESYNAFYEPSISRHAVVQKDLDDETHILGADYTLELQANKVTVKVASNASLSLGAQGLWRAPSPTTVAVVNLEANISYSDLSIAVSSTTDPPFANAGFLVIDNEIIRYTSKTDVTFDNLQRGVLGTVATDHSLSTPVREVRHWDLKYNKAPAFNIKDPFITGIAYESPSLIDILRWDPSSYGATFTVAASVNVPKGTFAFLEGVDPLSGKVSFTSIAGIPVVPLEENEQVQEQTASSQTSIKKYGLQELVIESPYITSYDHAQKIADFIISKMADGVNIINFNSVITPTLQVGDRVRVTKMDAFQIENKEYWVTTKTVGYGQNMNQQIVLRRVASDDVSEQVVYNPETSLGWHSSFFAESDQMTTTYGEGDPVGTWLNGTSGFDLVQATQAYKPTFDVANAAFNGKSAVVFDGVDDFLATSTLTGLSGSQLTIVVIGRFATVNIIRDMFGSTNTSNQFDFGITSSGGGYTLGTGNLTNGLVSHGSADTAVHLFRLESNEGTADDIRVDEALLVSTGKGNENLNALRVGSSAYNPSAADVEIAFVGIYNGDPAVVESEAWDGFKAWVSSHYGITVA